MLSPALPDPFSFDPFKLFVMPARSRIFGLDVLRALAVLLVFISHALRFSPLGPQTLTRLELYMGFTGVELFFALSGFLIGGILLRESEKKFSAAAVVKFWFRRWMR